MNLLITDGWIVSEKVIKGGAVAIEGNRIIDVGKAEDLKRKYTRYERIDARNKVVIPGLINTHTHAAMSLLRGYADDLPLKTWLEKWIWPLESQLTDKDVELGAKLAAAESLLSGVTTVYSQYYYFPEHNEAKAFAEAGIRGVIGHACFSWRKDEDMKTIRNAVSRWHGSQEGRIRVSMAPHAPYTVDPEYFKEIEAVREELNEKYGDRGRITICTHVAEMRDEAKQIERAWNVKIPNSSIFRYLDSLGVLSSDFLAAHSIYVTKEDLAIMKRRGVSISHNPVSNFKLASGLCPVPSLIKQGINVSLGTDGAASNNSLDMFETMKFASLIHKFGTLSPEILPAKTVFEMATRNGALALHWEKLGKIAKNYIADLVVMDVKKPHTVPMYNVYSHLVYAVKALDADVVIVNGKILVENGKLLTIDTEKLIEEVEVRQQLILEKVGKTFKAA